MSNSKGHYIFVKWFKHPKTGQVIYVPIMEKKHLEFG